MRRNRIYQRWHHHDPEKVQRMRLWSSNRKSCTQEEYFELILEWEHSVSNYFFKYHSCYTDGKEGHKETKCWSGGKAPSIIKVAAEKETRPPNSPSVVSSAYENDGTNWWQHVTLIINGQKVRLQLNTASGTTLIPRKTWEEKEAMDIIGVESVNRHKLSAA